MSVSFQAYMRPLETVMVFKYFGRVLTASDDDWLAVVDKLWKARSRWAYLSRILGREGADPWNSVNFDKAVVQANIFFGSDASVMTLRIGRTLSGFHQSVSRRLVRMRPKQHMTGQW